MWTSIRCKNKLQRRYEIELFYYPIKTHDDVMLVQLIDKNASSVTKISRAYIYFCDGTFERF